MKYHMHVPGLGYLQSFVDTPCGRGHATFTTERKYALTFATRSAAFAFWQQQSKTVPRRADGKANRPLTGYPQTEILREDKTPIGVYDYSTLTRFF